MQKYSNLLFSNIVLMFCSSIMFSGISVLHIVSLYLFVRPFLYVKSVSFLTQTMHEGNISPSVQSLFGPLFWVFFQPYIYMPLFCFLHLF